MSRSGCPCRCILSILSVVVPVALGLHPGLAAAQVVFATDFESGLPAEISATGSAIQGVQGWNGLGPPGRQFSGSFLRYTSQPLFDTTLTLTNLPAHDTVELRFLLALIDSWDGTELMKVSVDGAEVFSHWFQLATGDTSSYNAPAGALLSSGTNLGFTNGTWYFHDRAYDMGADPTFLAIPHTAGTLVVTWHLGAVSGGAAQQWQGGSDESWAIDALSVAVSGATVDAPVVASSGFALDGPWPNPSRGGSLAVRFELPNSRPALLDLVDVTGRLVASRAVGGLGSGSHRVELAQGRRLAAGVYFLRLSQGADVRTRRAVVLE